MKRPIALLVAGLSFAGCTCGGPPDGVLGECEGETSLPPSVATDILFVIDDSNSMREEQAKVVAELGTFVASLVGGPVENDFQVGVITTGVSLRFRDCDPASPETFRVYPEASGRLQLGKRLDGAANPASTRRILAFDEADLLSQFELLVGQGIFGSGQEMGLEAVRLALTEPLSSGENAGFLRDGSRLLVVIVSDEDDCSDPTGTAFALEPLCGGACTEDTECAGPGRYCVPVDPANPAGARRCQVNHCETPEGHALLEPVQSYVDFFQGMDDGTGRRREVYLAVIGAVTDDASHAPARCQSATDEAFGAAVRYRAAVDALGDRGFVDSICRDSYADTLASIAALVSAPQTIDLPADPTDGRLLVVELDRDGETLRCHEGDGFTYEPPAGTAPARVTLSGRCRLRLGDGIRLRYFCAG